MEVDIDAGDSPHGGSDITVLCLVHQLHEFRLR